MNRNIIGLLLVAVFLSAPAWASSHGGGGETAPHGQSAAHPSPSPSPSPVPSAVPVSAADSKQLLKEFQKAQKAEFQALDHRQKAELKELKASQKMRLKEWETQERDARHKFFEEHRQGQDRRHYIQDFLARHKAFIQIQNDERTRIGREQDARIKSLKDDQANRLKEFQEFLKRGERPPARLWPDNSGR